MDRLIGARIRRLRTDAGHTQEELTAMLGLRHRQTLATIEDGTRRITPEELLAAARLFQVPVEHFTDPFAVHGEARMRFRLTDASVAVLGGVEARMGGWFGAYRRLAPEVGFPTPVLQRRLVLRTRPAAEDVVGAAERVAAELGLGDVPSSRLAGALEDVLSMLVIVADLGTGVASGSCLLSDLSGIAVDRRTPVRDRPLEIARNLFHLLTWDAMVPLRADLTGPGCARGRAERLGDEFARALLVPRAVVDGVPDRDGDLPGWVASEAARLGVAPHVVAGRLRAAGRRDAPVSDDAWAEAADASPEGDAEPPFGRRHMEVMSLAMRRGRVSVRRCARLLGMTVDDLLDALTAHGLPGPYDA